MKDLPRGWLSEGEANELRARASGLTVLELGAWKGRSTVVLAEVAKYVVSVDRHEGIPEVGGEDSLPDYLESVRTLPNVAIVIADFAAITPFLHGFDLIYIDGDHDAASVERDIKIALGIRPRMVAFHDWDFAEVRETAIEILEADGHYKDDLGCASVRVWTE